MEVPKFSIKVLDHPDKVSKFWDWLTHRPAGYVACDIETGSNPGGHELEIFRPGFHVRMMQFGDAQGGWAIPFQEWKGLVKGAFDWVSQSRTTHVWHNGFGYDAQALRQEGIIIDPTCMHDTQITAGIGGFAGESRKLKTLLRREFGPWASVGEDILHTGMKNAGWTWTDIPMGWKPYPMYGVVDVVGTSMLYEKWEPWRKQFAVHHDMEIATSVITNQMSRTGMMVDGEYLAEKIMQLAEEEDQLLQKSMAAGWGDPNKRTEVLRILREAGVLDEKRLTDGGQVSVDKKQMIQVGDKHPLAELRLKYMFVQRMRKDYLEKIFGLIGGEMSPQVIHPSIWSMAAKTSRMSVSNPPLQQMPSNDHTARRAFIPDNPDHVLIGADFGQIEMRTWAIMNNDQLLKDMFNEADRTGQDFFVLMARDLYREPDFQKSDPRRGPIKNTCVPLDTQILTQRGWLSHDEVQVGDQTIGYNDLTGQTEWTTVREVVHYQDAPLVEMGNKTWKVRCTPEHRWATTSDRYMQDPGWQTTEELFGPAGKKRRIRLAAPHNGAGFDITDTEAAILGWALSDGDIRISPLDGSSAQGGNGQRQGVYMEIRQSKHTDQIDLLVKEIPCRVVVRGDSYKVYTFEFEWARNLCARVGLLTADGMRPSYSALAGGFSHSQRDAALRSMHLADGKRALYKSDEWTRNLYRAMVLMSGHVVRTRERLADGRGWMKKSNYGIWSLIDGVTTQKMTWEDAGTADVWCVRTDLGSWAMSQDGLDMITGNSYATIYAGGDMTIAETAGLPLEQVQPTINALRERYPSFKDAGQSMVTKTADGIFEAWTPNGRRFRVREWKDKRVLPNWCGQGWAATILKDAAIGCRAAGLGDALRLAVHDELIFSVPREDAKDAAMEIEEIMNSQIDPAEHGVAIRAKANIGRNWAELK